MDYCYAKTCSIKASKTQRVVTDDYYPPVKFTDASKEKSGLNFKGMTVPGYMV